MAQLNTKQTALSLGLTFAVLHVLWAIAVGLGFAQSLLNWKLAHHFVIIEAGIAQFDIVTALVLVVCAFLTGAVLGWLFATIWNWTGKKIK
jgi:hypothetical protein